MKYFNKLLSLLIVVSCIYNSKAEICNAHNGPNGARHCIKSPSYEGYQWATCRTDTYLRSKTNGNHYCQYHFIHSYCYYQCMLEEYGTTNGEVIGKCRCSPSENSASKRATSMYNVGFLTLFAISFMFTTI